LGERVYAMWSDALEERLAQVTAIVVRNGDDEDSATAAEEDIADEPPLDTAAPTQPGLSAPEDDGIDTPAGDNANVSAPGAAPAPDADEAVDEKTHELLMALLHQFFPELPQ